MSKKKEENNNNLDLWNKVCKTDPKDTKQVSQRGGFTAIDANSQFRKATEVFGPIGVGWGAKIVDVNFTQNGMVAIQIDFWQGNPDNKFPAFGCCKLGTADRPDEDAFKKALTDAETKALSQLGFNHDVFQGKFDDNKYVQQMHEEFKEPEQWTGPIKKTALKKLLHAFNTDIKAVEDSGSMNELMSQSKEMRDQCEVDLPDWFEGMEKAIEEAVKRVETEDDGEFINPLQ